MRRHIHYLGSHPNKSMNGFNYLRGISPMGASPGPGNVLTPANSQTPTVTTQDGKNLYAYFGPNDLTTGAVGPLLLVASDGQVYDPVYDAAHKNIIGIGAVEPNLLYFAATDAVDWAPGAPQTYNSAGQAVVAQSSIASSPLIFGIIGLLVFLAVTKK